MSDFVQLPQQKSEESLALIAFRLDPNAEGPQLYTIIAYGGDNDRPLVRNGRLLFFTRPQKAQHALDLADNGMKSLGAAPQEIEMLCDIGEALHVINSQDTDPDGVILDVIGCFDDLVRAAQVNTPAEYMAALSAMSERLLESNEFATFLAEKGIDRERVEDAIMWCVGAVAVKASITR